jgi:hypothetical protein
MTIRLFIMASADKFTVLFYTTRKHFVCIWAFSLIYETQNTTFLYISSVDAFSYCNKMLEHC